MLSENIKSLRRALGLTQATLAAQAKVSQGYLSQIENAEVENVSVNVALRLAATLNVNVYELMGSDGVPISRPLIHPVLLDRVERLNTRQQLTLLRFLREVQHQSTGQAN